MAKFKSTQKTKKNSNNNKKVLANKIKKKAMKTKVGDARQRIIAKSRTNMVDARDKLTKMAKGTDARAKLQKIRNLKEGKLDVKKTSKGRITIVTTTQGQLQLTTKRKETQMKKTGGNPNAMVSKIGKNLTKSIAPSGQISLSTKPKNSALTASSAKAKKQVPKQQQQANKRLPLKTKAIRKTIKSRAAELDDELMNTHVDPIVIKRTVQNSVRGYARSPSPLRSRYRSRSRSPVRRDYDRYHYDDPRREAREEELLRQRIREADLRRSYEPSYLTSEAMAQPSPFLGTKVVVSNLCSSVSHEDLSELFGDIGPLRRVKMVAQGSAEVVFINKEDADRAIEVYHNRQLDGQPMKCQLISTGPPPRPSTTSSLRLPSSSRRYEDAERYSAPRSSLDVSSIHKALFSERKKPVQSSAVPYASSGSTTNVAPSNTHKFTVVMPKKGQAGMGRGGRSQQPHRRLR